MDEPPILIPDSLDTPTKPSAEDEEEEEKKEPS